MKQNHAPVRLRAEDLFDPDVQAHYNYITQIRTVTRPHDHDFCEVFLIAYGRVIHCLGEKEEQLEAGSLVLMRPWDVHAYLPVGDEPCGIINLAFPTQVLQRALEYLFDGADRTPLWTAEHPALRRLSEEETGAVVRRMEAFQAMWVQDKEGQRRMLRRLLMDLLMRYFCQESGPGAPHAPEWLEKLRLEMQSPRAFTRGLPEMVERCPKTTEHMYRQFRRYYGQTPAAYLNALRVNYAANLLRTTDRPILEIALEAGFDNLSYFYGLFRRRFGMSPGRFRRQSYTSAVLPKEEEAP